MNKIIGNDYIFNTRKIRLVAIEGEKAVYWIYEDGRYDWLNIANIAKLHVIDKPQAKSTESKPAYTQALCDAGELPSVGMECLIDDCKGNNFFKRFDGKVLTIVSHDKNYQNLDVAVFKYDDGNGEFDYHALLAHKFKPLTPPIELIGGKAYQFELMGVEQCGIYRYLNDSFYDAMGDYMSRDCTNIKLLEVKS
jgi:hypothetical protein